ncbi:alpha- and gamma-adaptin-binding protein p34-like isoform X1 [Euwallacea similis]|uniref:alpha- and gamma-adaptin-binding protein p34-like isoform X1 n=1 Tax=Euwallacea similis TaxID=1736056 RepID=UPI00344D5DA6
MNDLPSIVVVSSSSTKPRSIIKLITKENPVEHTCGLIKQPWKIDTKYYSAFVTFLGMPGTYERSDEFNSQVEALVIHMDSNKESGLDDLKQWEKLETECDPEIKLLISNYCNDNTKITKSAATDWCLSRGFELIELYPSEIPAANSEEDIIPEKFGVNRLIEALQAHTWSNLVMKKSKAMSKLNSEALKPSSDGASEGTPGLPEDLLGEDDFTELFSHLHMMKDSLQSLPVAQRKQCAEQMVTAFWRAIGGDEEELLDL